MASSEAEDECAKPDALCIPFAVREKIIRNVDPSEQIALCEAALLSAHEAINSQSMTIEMLDEQNKRLSTALDLASSQAAAGRAWYKDPAFLVPIGFVLGVTAGAFAVRGR